MDLKDVGATLLRRWYLSIVAVLCAVGIALLVFDKVGPTYSGESTTVLIPPAILIQRQQTSGVYAPANPLLYLSGLTDTRDVLIRSLASKDIVDDVQAKNPNLTYQATNDPLSSGPLVVVTADAPTEQQALEGARYVSSLLPTTLVRIQDQLGVKQDARITSLVLTADGRATVVRKKQIQATGLAGIGSLVALLLGVAVTDGLLNDRSRRRARRASVSTEPDWPPTGGSSELEEVPVLAGEGRHERVYETSSRAGHAARS